MRAIFLRLLLFLTLTPILRAQDMPSRFDKYPVRNVGPVVQGGRIVDIAAHPTNGSKFYIAYASGGIYMTVNNGITFSPIFDDQGILTIGDMAIAPSNPDIIYVGTGENNSSRSSYAGDGIYKSVDGGLSWNHIGLENSQHIGKILVHPENSDVVWVAAMGGLYSDNEERGIYKSKDGGETWKKTLYVDDKTGGIDLVINPQEPSILYASMWQRKRSAWNFEGNGSGSGIYKSVDGGESWDLSMNGLPADEFTGRIGLDISQSNPGVLYAVLDYQKESKKEKKDESNAEELKLADFNDMSTSTFLGLSNEVLDELLRKEGFPERYNAVNIKKEIKAGIYGLEALTNYFGNANEALFNTEVAGLIVYRSDNDGVSWERTHEYSLDGVYYTYGYYFGEVRISPDNADELYVLGVPLIKSTDAGKTFERTDTIGSVHSDHQSMWIDPGNPDHIILGNDGGLYITYDRGASWDHKNNMSVGQFYTVNIDMEEPYNIYGGLQDNGTLVGSSQTIPAVSVEWERLFGGDGMYVSADPRNANTVYVGFQFGNYYKLDRDADESSYITPSHNIGDDKLRFNWRTPVLMSSHNPDILYLGSQKVHRTVNQGDSWEEISDDLTNGIREGNVPYGTITEIAESPLTFGRLFVGTDDGNIWRYDIATGWKKLNNDLPKELWVSSIHPSAHDKNVVYLSLTGYRKDDFKTYLYRSADNGDTWGSISNNIKDEPANVIYEDLTNSEVLYLGTDKGTYLSINTGEVWEKFGGLPNVAAYDMVIHPREQDLVIGTHGRSVYVTNLEAIHKLKAEISADVNLVSYEIKDIRHSNNWGNKRYPYLKVDNPVIEFSFFVKDLVSEKKMEIIVKNENKEIIKILKPIIKEAGFVTCAWDGIVSDKQQQKQQDNYIQKGNYSVEFKLGNDKTVESLEVK